MYAVKPVPFPPFAAGAAPATPLLLGRGDGMAENSDSFVASTETVESTRLHTSARPQPGRVVVEVRGEIDLSNVALFDLALADHTATPWLVADMSDVRFCGVAGARVLELAALRATATGRRFEVVASRAVARLLVATNLADTVACVGDPMVAAPARYRSFSDTEESKSVR